MIRKNSTTCEIVNREALNNSERRDMLSLFASYFHVESPPLFYDDLDRKDLVFLIRDEERVIRGFSTLAVAIRRHRDRELLVLFSGDTIIHRDYWGGAGLPSLWIRTAMDLSDRYGLETYWLLITGGFRTYRYLPLFCHSFYPSPSTVSDADLRDLRNHLAKDRFGPAFDPATGVVRFAQGATPLREGVGDIDEKRLKNPHISFFASSNPGHSMGDELVCLASLDRSNLTPAARRVLSPDHRF